MVWHELQKAERYDQGWENSTGSHFCRVSWGTKEKG
jgi:hypothetical protein